MKASLCATENESLRLEIEDFFDQAASRRNIPYVCAACGKKMKYLNATFLLYGTESSWEIRLPVCGCKAA